MNGATFGISDLPTADLARIADTCEAVAVGLESSGSERDLEVADDLSTAAQIVRAYGAIPDPTIARPKALPGQIGTLFGIPVVEVEGMPEHEIRIGHYPSRADDPSSRL